ncbi:MAG TPA: NADH-quinone oxidoreductase subunit M [Verrucomicrobiae bacterium]|nr:NADH-quinone oxidoreductase subunit M [Verrucomicrobiae bacterium]
MDWLLTIAVLLPIAAAFLAFLFPARKPGAIRALAIFATGVSLLMILTLFAHFNRSAAGYQFVYGIEWLPTLGISLKFGVDGISMTLLLLVGFVSFAGTLISHEIHDRQKEYYILFLALTTGISGTFATMDLFFFYFFYELAVIPMYLLIGMWGSLPPGKHGRTKEYATMKLTLYLTAGAVLALLGLLMIYYATGTMDIEKLQRNVWVASSTQMRAFPCLLFGFGFLASMWPFHTWSPLGYAAAPTAASMMHAGVLKKLGAYGIIRLALPLLPEGARHWADLIAILACFNILYAGWSALKQRDWKFVIGYSSVSHMGYVLLGIATLNVIGVSGAVLLMFAHGVMAALTFALIGWFYHQTHNRFVPELSGLARKIPFIGTCMVMAVMASSGLPGFANFVSEVMVFIGAWKQGSTVFRIATICAVWGIVVTATYLLWAVRTSFFGPFDEKWSMLKDAVRLKHKFPYALLLAVLLVVGFWPRLLTDIIQRSVETNIVAAVGHPGMAGNRGKDVAPAFDGEPRVASATTAVAGRRVPFFGGGR